VHPDDIEFASRVDSFDFALAVTPDGNRLRMHAVKTHPAT
jgi:hypothetical protein